MDKVLKIDPLLERILDELCAKDLMNTQLVSQRWYDASKRILSRRPSTFFCMKILNEKKWFKDSGSQFLGVLRDGNKRVSIKCNSSPSMARKFEKFISDNRMCSPFFSITFGRLDGPLCDGAYHEMEHGFVPRDCPGIVIAGRGTISQQTIMHDHNNQRIQSPRNMVGTPDGIASILLSRFNSDLHITVTNWNYSESVEPKINDPDNPLRAVLVFSEASCCLTKNKRMLNFLTRVRHLRDTVHIAGPTRAIFHLKDPTTSEPLGHPGLTSIAFSGNNVRAAKFTFQSADDDQMRRQIMDFKKSLKFDCDSNDPHEQTFGFIFDHVCSRPVDQYFRKVQSIFPKVNFIGCTFSTFLLVNMCLCRFCYGDYPPIYEDDDYEYHESEEHVREFKNELSSSAIDSTYIDDFLQFREVTIFLIHLNNGYGD